MDLIEVAIQINIPGVGSESIAITRRRTVATADDPVDAATTLLAEAVGYAADWMDAGCPQVGDASGSAQISAIVEQEGLPY